MVVATHRRKERLRALVRALEAQTLPPREVAIVDDESGDGTVELLEELRCASALDLRVLRTGTNGGPAKARNIGWRTTTAPLVAFTDDDCVPEPGWLAGVAAAFADLDVVQGRTVPDPDEWHLAGPFGRSMSVPVMSPFFEACNIAYRRSVLDGAGGFDECFTYAAGEDSDLAIRVIEAGARAGFAADAVVRHAVHPSRFGDALRNTRRIDGLVHLALRHPSLQQHFVGRVFWLPAHGRAALAGAGAAAAAVLAARGRWAGALAAAGVAAPYAWYRLRTAPIGPSTFEQRVATLPGALAVDLVELTRLSASRLRRSRSAGAGSRSDPPPPAGGRPGPPAAGGPWPGPGATAGRSG